MKYKIFYLGVLLSLFSIEIICQDSLVIDSELSFITKGQHNLSALSPNLDCWHCTTRGIDDNPLFHLGIYTGIDHTLTINNNYRIETGLYLEERSYSGGNNTLSNIVIFPKILLEVTDTIRVKSKDIGVHLKGGDYWNEDIHDILRIYNIDYQALEGKLSLGAWDIRMMTIGDLSKNVGLDLHQTYRFALGYSLKSYKNLSYITVNELVNAPRGKHPTATDINFTNFSQYQVNPSLKVEGQLEYRMNSELIYAYAAGIKANYKSKNLTTSIALRYYTENFNLGYNGFQPRYVNGSGRYVGPQLYPLKNFYRNYAQWAAYTHTSQSSLIALAFAATGSNMLYKKLGAFYIIDINYIHNINRQKGLLYPFYNAGFQINFLENFIGKISITNKHMDLRNFYQTFTMSKLPFLSLGVHMRLDNIRLRRKII